ncbi:hypothetical protein KKF82_08665 [Patescibacteria group bacterium]|nr:hypothetical protein [Patescibacteria group bacterium]
MPRRDRMTGCEVMTTKEYFEAEADGSGREWHELMGDMLDEMSEDEHREEERLLESGDAEKKVIAMSLVDNAEGNLNWYIQSASIKEVRISNNFQGASTTIESRAFCSDGKTREVVFKDEEQFDTMREPGYYDWSWVIDGEKFG